MFAKKDATGVYRIAGYFTLLAEFGAPPTVEEAAAKGYIALSYVAPPQSPYNLEAVVEVADGIPVLAWAPVDTPQALVDDRTEKQKRAIRLLRDNKIARVAWRYERHARQTRLGLTPQDDLAALDNYVQALADLPQQPGFPWDVSWPEEP